MLNLDTEEDNELTIGCAGGIDVTAAGSYASTSPTQTKAFTLSLKGLTGGHSGIDIHRGRANANKLMNRVLWNLTREFGIEIASVSGGSLRNAIPRESVSTICVAENHAIALTHRIEALNNILQTEYRTTDPNLHLFCLAADCPETVMVKDFQLTLLRSLYACQHGIYRMSADIAGLVQTSNNLSKVDIKDGAYSIQCLTRSSVDTEKTDLVNALTATFELLGATTTYGGDYPGWIPNPHAGIVQLMSHLYEELFGETAHVSACHAGLECGILGTNYPDIQMISFGPNIYGAHSPDERVQITSVQKFWSFLLETLKRIPKKE